MMTIIRKCIAKLHTCKVTSLLLESIVYMLANYAEATIKWGQQRLTLYNNNIYNYIYYYHKIITL